MAGAFAQYGMGAVLTFDPKNAVQGTRRASNAFKALEQRMNRVKASAAKVGAGMRQMAMGGAGLSLMFGYGIKQAANFEQAMSGVQAVLLKTKEETSDLTAMAKRLGVITAFTATEAAQGMENLARAGFNQEEILGAIPGVLNAAAAEGMAVADSASIIANTVRAFGMEASEATHVADVMALVSSRTNTTIAQMGDGMRYAQTQAKNMGISLEETTAMLGMLANAGMQGSIGGTSFTNMLVKMVKPSKKSQQMMRELGVSFVTYRDEAGKTRVNLGETMAGIGEAFMSITDPVKKARMAAEIFGIRGQKAAGAFVAQIEKSPELFTQLTNALWQSSEMFDGQGAAAYMASRRLDNLIGSFTLLKSSVESFFIESFGDLLPGASKGVKGLTDALNGMVTVMQVLGMQARGETVPEFLQQEADKASPKIWAMARAVKDLMQNIADGAAWAKNKLVALIDGVTEFLGPKATGKLTKVLLGLGMVMAILPPIALALASIGWVAGGAWAVITGLAGAISAAFWPVVLIAGALYGAFQLVRQEGESAGDTFKRLWAGVIDIWGRFKAGVDEFIDGFMAAWGPIWTEVKAAFVPVIEELKEVWSIFAGAFQEDGSEMGSTIKQIGMIAAVVVGTVLTTVAKILRFVIAVFKRVMDHGLGPFIHGLKNVVGGFIDILTGATSLREGLKRMFMGLVDILLTPIRTIIGAISGVVEAVWNTKIGRGALSALGVNAEDIANMNESLRINSVSRGDSPPTIPDQTAPTLSNQLNAANAGAANQGGAPVNVQASDVNATINNRTVVELDGQVVAETVAQHNLELNERSGEVIDPNTRHNTNTNGAQSPAPTGG